MKAAVDSMDPETVTLAIDFVRHELLDIGDSILNWDAKQSALTVQRALKNKDPAALVQVVPTVSSVRWGQPIREMKLRLMCNIPSVTMKSLKMQMHPTGAFLSELSLVNLEENSAIWISQASFPRIQKLSIQNPCAPLAALLPPLTASLRGITEVSIELTRDVWLVPGSDRAPGNNTLITDDEKAIGRPLSSLSSLPDLQSLEIIYHMTPTDIDCGTFHVYASIMNGFMEGISEITQLRRLNFEGLMMNDLANFRCFGNMLSRLAQLEELAELTPFTLGESKCIWDTVRAAGVKSTPLKKLDLHLCWFSVVKLERLAKACNELFPELTCLEMHLSNHLHVGVEEAYIALSSLRGHPSLRRVSFAVDCPWTEDDMLCFVSLCKDNFGPNIEVEGTFHD